MEAVEVIYGSDSYSVIDTDLESVVRRIADILDSGKAGWIVAYDGHGTKEPYRLLVTAGVPIAIGQVPDS